MAGPGFGPGVCEKIRGSRWRIMAQSSHPACSPTFFRHELALDLFFNYPITAAGVLQHFPDWNRTTAFRFVLG
jgi:hypothetical protein